MSSPSTPHIQPNGAPIAKTILLPGDPLRAKFIAETFLEDAVQFNAVRGALGFTGTYQGHEVSVMGSGMGIPSISLYAHELIHVFGVDRLIRIGSCGSLQKELDLYSVVAATAVSYDTNFMNQFNLPGTFAPTASWKLLDGLRKQAEAQNVDVTYGNVLSSDIFYHADETANDRWASMGVLGVEMESAGLYATAAAAGVDALGVFTVSDNIVTGAVTTPEERQTAFTAMMKLALPLAGLER